MRRWVGSSVTAQVYAALSFFSFKFDRLLISQENNMFNYNHLYYFYMTAKEGGVMNASRHLRIAQPSLSAQIKTLEGELNLSLFRKVGRRLVLTPDGERAFGYCRKIFEAADEFSDHLKHSGSAKAHRCRIGVTQEVERPFIADILSGILRNKKAHEQPMLSMISDDHATLIESLRIGELDAVITNLPAYGPDVKITTQLSMPVIAVGSPRLLKKIVMKKNGSLSKILKENEIGLVLPSDRLRIRIETDLFLQKFHLRNRLVFESDMLVAVVHAALAGVGIAFLPQPYVARELNHGTLLKVGGETLLWSHSIFIIVRDTKTADPVVREIQDHFVGLGAKSPLSTRM
jgi:LysR family transcriptional activator of nhaA